VIPPPAHIQQALDREFPGVRLEWNAFLGYWVLTDRLFHIDGTEAYDACYPAPTALRGIEPYAYTNRKVIWVVGDLATGERWPLYCERIIEALQRAHRGVKPEQVEEYLDALEASEAAQEQRERAEQSKAAREAGAAAWDGMKRSIFSRSGRRTPYSYAKAVDRAFEKKRAQEDSEDLAAAEAEVLYRARRGEVTTVQRSIGVPNGAAR
jgi:hypothetical protein